MQSYSCPYEITKWENMRLLHKHAANRFLICYFNRKLILCIILWNILYGLWSMVWHICNPNACIIYTILYNNVYFYGWQNKLGSEKSEGVLMFVGNSLGIH